MRAFARLLFVVIPMTQSKIIPILVNIQKCVAYAEDPYQPALTLIAPFCLNF